MRKSLLFTFVIALTVALLCFSMVTASAATVESKPAGDGLITSENEINSTNFKVLEQDDGDADAYKTVKVTDNVLRYNNGEWQEMIVGTPVSKELMAKENAKVTLTYNIIGLNADSAQLMIEPGAKNSDEIFNYGYVLTGGDNGIAVVPAYRTKAATTDPASKLIAHHGGGTQYDIPVQWQAYSWSCGTFKNYINAYKNATFKIEMAVNEGGWVDVTLISGFFYEWQRWTNGGATITNWAPYDGTHDFYTNVWARYCDGMVLDGAKLEVSYTEDGEAKSTVLFNSNFDDESKVITTQGATAESGKFIARGVAYGPNGSSGLRVTNPAENTGIITRAALVADTSLSRNFELNANVILESMTEGQKVGFGFGFEDSRDLTKNHKYLYLTVKNGTIMFGGEEVTADGTIFILAEYEVTGAALNQPVTVQLTGAGEDLKINVGDAAETTIEDFDLNGFFAIFHKGTGDITYMLKDNLTMTGYKFTENEEGAEAVTSNFNGNYLNTNKFQMSSHIAPDIHMVKTENSHELTGLTPENGKLGFYGTSTGTRILTTKKYADFVMQFDYISLPAQQRGGLVLPGNRPSPLFLVFGMKEGGLPIDDASVYAIGLYEGIATEFYGFNETVISSLGMANTCGMNTVGIAKVKEATEKSDISIPYYASGKGYDASAENNNVAAWYDPDPQAEGTVYSLYNKVTRIKLVCVDNNVKLFFTEVASDGTTGNYIEVASFKAQDAEGYLGIATDSPAFFEIDNLAITPVTKEQVLTFVASGEALTASVVADVAPEDMDEDLAPTPLAKPVIEVNAKTKKATWQAVEGAKDYTVTLKKGTETILESTITATEIDLSSVTELGEYKLTVVANPANENVHLSSRNTVDYKVEAQGSDTSGGTTGDTSGDTDDGGCFSGIGVTLFAGIFAIAFAGAKLRKKQDR